jgi:hypothetical protein
MASNRAKVGADELQQELAAAFKRIKPTGCRTCTIPQPRFMPRTDDRIPNWELPFDESCEFGCANFVRWLARQFGALYDLEEPR